MSKMLTILNSAHVTRIALLVVGAFVTALSAATLVLQWETLRPHHLVAIGALLVAGASCFYLAIASIRTFGWGRPLKSRT